MLEWLAIPAVIGAAAFIPKGKMSDKKKIEEIFKRHGMCIGDKDNKQFPKLVSVNSLETHTTYVYRLPLGLYSEQFDSLKQPLIEALGHEIEFDFEDGMLKLEVYKQDLPESWNYTEDLIRPNTWEVPIGRNHKGILYHDFDKYAHFLIGGVPGFGKTVLMKSMFTTLLLNNPEHVEFYLLDLKGGLEFSKFGGLPQVRKVTCDVYETAETLHEIVENMKEMEKEFRKRGYTNIVDTPIKKRTFVIVDEGAELSPDGVEGEAKKYAKYCQSTLSEIARIGRAVGYRLIYATQYPSAKSVSMSIKMNIVSRISFIAASQVSSRVILDEVGAEELPSLPGRAIYKVEKKRLVQVPFITDKQMFTLMEGRLGDGKDRKIVTDDRSVRHGKNQTPTKNP